MCVRVCSLLPQEVLLSTVIMEVQSVCVCVCCSYHPLPPVHSSSLPPRVTSARPRQLSPTHHNFPSKLHMHPSTCHCNPSHTSTAFTTTVEKPCASMKTGAKIDLYLRSRDGKPVPTTTLHACQPSRSHTRSNFPSPTTKQSLLSLSLPNLYLTTLYTIS